MMGNAQQPTRRTRHIDLKKFALLEWVQRDLILMKRISTNDNCSDGMTKQTGRQLFYRHFDYIMGKLIPDYVTSIEKHPNQINTTRKVSFLDNDKQNLCKEEGIVHMALSSTQGISMIDNTSYTVCSMEHGGDVIPSK